MKRLLSFVIPLRFQTRYSATIGAPEHSPDGSLSVNMEIAPEEENGFTPPVLVARWWQWAGHAFRLRASFEGKAP